MFGFSRDDCQSFLPEYLQMHLLAADPFASLDVRGVGAVMRTAVQVSGSDRDGEEGEWMVLSPGQHLPRFAVSSFSPAPTTPSQHVSLLRTPHPENPSLQPRLQDRRVRRAQRRPQVHQVRVLPLANRIDCAPLYASGWMMMVCVWTDDDG